MEIYLTESIIRGGMAMNSVPTLNREDVPPALWQLIPLAEVWGIGDDRDRDRKVQLAEDSALEALVAFLDCDDLMANLNEWLAGEESYAEPMSEAYAAFTSLIMAAEFAQSRLANRR